MTWKRLPNLLLRGGTVVTSRGSRRADVLVRGGRIVSVGEGLEGGGARVEDVTDLHLAPGFVDIHVHLRDPGALDSEDLSTGMESAARGGFHHVYCMANTDPVNDSARLTGDLVARARKISPLALHPVAAVTQGLVGTQLTDFSELKAAGAGAVSNDGMPVEDPRTLARALERAREAGLALFTHAEDRALAAGGAVDARAARLLQARGIPVEAEDVGTARDIEVSLETGVPLHVCHVSTAGSLALVREARRRGGAVTAEATPHHIALTYDDIPRGDTDFKMNPPLRAPSDVKALLEGIRDGTITAIATDHAPHAPVRKQVSMDQAPFGAIGLETSFSVAYTTLVDTGLISLERLIGLYVDGPAAIAGLSCPALAAGAPALITLLDVKGAWSVDPGRLASRSRNCPFKGRTLRGSVTGLLSGELFRRF
ncbi:MAG: dihydroorotase [Planctomycetaceae bacterium]